MWLAVDGWVSEVVDMVMPLCYCRRKMNMEVDWPRRRHGSQITGGPAVPKSGNFDCALSTPVPYGY